jgi:hypothetical protein
LFCPVESQGGDDLERRAQQPADHGIFIALDAAACETAERPERVAADEGGDRRRLAFGPVGLDHPVQMAAGRHEDPGAPPIEAHQPVEAEIEAAAPGVPGDDDRGGDIGAGLDLGVPAGRECFEIDRLAAQYLVADGGCSSGQRAGGRGRS